MEQLLPTGEWTRGDANKKEPDYFYNNINTYNQALEEYFNAKKYARNLEQTIDITKIEKRIYDMQLRMDENVFKEIESKYE